MSLDKPVAGAACDRSFTLANKTDTLGFGGYAFEFSFSARENAAAQWRKPGRPQRFLTPILPLDFSVSPEDSAAPASLRLIGEATSEALAVDAVVFILRSAISLAGADCIVPLDQLVVLSERLLTRSGYAFDRLKEIDGWGALAELSPLLDEFLSVAVSSVRDIGLQCVADAISQKLLGNYKAIGQISLAYVTWIGRRMWDYWSYQDRPITFSLAYKPSAIPATVEPLSFRFTARLGLGEYRANERAELCYQLVPADAPFRVRLLASLNGGAFRQVDEWADTGGGDCTAEPVGSNTGTVRWRIEASVDGNKVGETTLEFRVSGTIAPPPTPPPPAITLVPPPPVSASATPVTCPVPQGASTSAPTFLYPVNGQVIDYGPGSHYLFRVNPVAGVRDYLWQFYQGGTLVWENLRDGGALSSDEYGIFEGTTAHSRLRPGGVQVSVTGMICGQRTRTATISLNLVPANQAPTPTPRPTCVNNNVLRGTLSQFGDYDLLLSNCAFGVGTILLIDSEQVRVSGVLGMVGTSYRYSIERGVGGTAVAPHQIYRSLIVFVCVGAPC